MEKSFDTYTGNKPRLQKIADAVSRTLDMYAESPKVRLLIKIEDEKRRRKQIVNGNK